MGIGQVTPNSFFSGGLYPLQKITPAFRAGVSEGRTAFGYLIS